MRTQATAGYAPLPLTTDAASLGLVSTRLDRPAGAIAARHRPERTSSRATLFLHGAAGSWTTWTPLLALHEFENPVLLDLPGWGDVTPAASDPDVTLAVICELVREVALELGYTEWDVVGHSMGGLIALHLATLWPQTVRSVRMVSGTAESVVDAVGHPLRALGRLPGFVLFRAVMIALSTGDGGARAFVRFLARAHLLRPFVTPLFRHPLRVDRSVVTALGEELRPRSFATATRAVDGYDVRAWDSIACPVFSTKGDRDVFVRDGDLRGAATVIADCGHFGTVERPVEVLAALGYR